ncbi:macrophage mannose receptor 1-like [Amphiprion ocellaris]|uniref:macrophage mannose receptor 1-like n=1 Tax=Amphiprion ocellaris TaxID=80972 RepID=UPI00241175F2|nr:macrophage mannose receptor 1-like [Amphiprion ocellaris]
MMESIWLGVLCLSGWLVLPVCSLRQYYFVNNPLTWNESQTYCRQKYTDLATIENTEDMKELESLVSSANVKSEVWFGLYSEINWKWSDGFTGSRAEYRAWTDRGNNFAMGSFCVSSWTNWSSINCDLLRRFICYRGTEDNRQFVSVKKSMNWSDAQKYCRENFVDLVTVRNNSEQQKIWNKVKYIGGSWIGLFRDPDLYWSDGSSFSWSSFGGSTPIGSMTVLCGSMSLKRSMKWKLLNCEQRFPFVCHGVPDKRQVVKLRIEMKDNSMDLNNPEVKAELLKKLQDRLKDNGESEVTLRWREQPDGKVFYKEETQGTCPAT